MEVTTITNMKSHLKKRRKRKREGTEKAMLKKYGVKSAMEIPEKRAQGQET